MAADPSPEADLWLLLGPFVRDTPTTHRLAAALAEAFGPRFAAVPTDRLLLGVTGGELTLHDLTGRRIEPPRVAVLRLATTSLSMDREVTLMRQLEALGTELVNPMDATLTCVNKFWQLQRLAEAGLPVPDTRTHTDARPGRAVAAGIPEPCVVKSVRGSGGRRVFLAPDAATVADLQGSLRTDVPFLFQRYVRHSHGRDLRVIVVDGRVVAAGERRAPDGRLQSNTAIGGVIEPCLGRYPAAEQLAVRAAERLGLVFCGVDLLFEEGRAATPEGDASAAEGEAFTVCEVNANAAWGDRMPDVTPALVAAITKRLT
ncbi:RimK family alpha-L-glutamate ligase [Kitasatospora sp. NPDC059795]|uniref:RimK family alpha-L-glutamate ligase n=1 Tax=Kitasatospora sp. NPDC059795 TaxID=3346949 RepID=UPI00364B60F8